MNSFLKKNKCILFLFLIFFSLTLNSQKPLRVGYINMDYILSNIDDYKTANEEYDIKLNLWRKEIESRTNKIESRLKELAIKKPLLPDEVYQNLIDEIDFDKKQLEQYAQKRFGPKVTGWFKRRFLYNQFRMRYLQLFKKLQIKINLILFLTNHQL